MFKKEYNRGFSLLELAIVVTVIGISLAAGVSVVSEYSDQSKIEQTDAKLEEIIDAIDDYADEYNRLPCPADLTDLFGSSTYGASDFSGTTCDSETITGGGSSPVLMGLLPTKDLNLYPSLAIDGWGNRFTYIIRENIAKVNGLDESDIDIDLHDFSGLTRFDDVVVIVLSHGENGFGSYRGRGGNNRISATDGISQEDNNNDPDADFHTSVSVAGFDDILYYRTLTQLTDPSMEE